MAQMILGPTRTFGFLSDQPNYGALIAVAAAMFFLALRRRRRDNWRWPGLGTFGALKAIGVSIGLTAFLFVFSQDFFPRPNTPVDRGIFENRQTPNTKCRKNPLTI